MKVGGEHLEKVTATAEGLQNGISASGLGRAGSSFRRVVVPTSRGGRSSANEGWEELREW